MIISPRCCVLSAKKVVPIVTKKLRKKGGAESPCARTAVKPTKEELSISHKQDAQVGSNLLSLKIVGRNTGNEEKLTLTEKYMSCDMSVMKS